MKKLLIILFFAILGQEAIAQEGTKVGVSFGPAFTFTRTEVDGKLIDSGKQNGVGSRLALNVRRGFTENYGIQTGVALTTRAYGKKDDADGKTKLSTVEIPVGVSLRTNELGNGLFVSGFVGPTLDLVVSARNKSDTDGDRDVKKNFNTIGSTLKFGLTGEKEFDFGTVSFGFSYNRGLTNISDSGNTETKVHYFAIEAGYFF